MRGVISGASQFITSTALDIRDALRRDFDYFYEDKPWRFRGVYLRLPMADIGPFIEWREVNVGLGWERSDDGQDVALFCGRFQGSLSMKQKVRA